MSLNQRVCYKQRQGTIRFVGDLPGHSGCWYGIEWDDPLRGKHNGVFNGTKYFNTEYENAGSFVKSSEVFFGNDFITALNNRYAYDVEEVRSLWDNAVQELAFTGVKFAQFADVENRMPTRMDQLHLVELVGQYVNGAGTPGEILNTCPNIDDLDISQNLMNSWATVAQITSQLRFLQTLIINDSRLVIPKNCAESRPAFQNLTNLVMCRNNYTWNDILTAAQMWPQITTLSVAYNRANTLLEPSDVLLHLLELDLRGNSLEKWTEINKLKHLTKLEILKLDYNELNSIDIPEDDTFFPALTYLSLSHNSFKQWHSINDLNKLRSLTNLIFKKNPIAEDITYAEARRNVVARVSNIKSLNGTVISKQERQDAEYDYLKTVADEFSHSINKADVEARHPRYKILAQQYGASEQDQRPSMTFLKSNMVELKIKRMDAAETESEAVYITKRVPLSMTVANFIAIVRKLFRITSRDLILTRIPSENADIKIEMNDVRKELAAYSIEEGDTIAFQLP